MVAVVAQGEAMLSDFVVPYGVLAQSGAARVVAVNMFGGPLKAGPLTITPDMTAAEFDRAYPEGADYVIVPATAGKHGEELAWLRGQRAHGAALVSICDGVELLAEAGALDGRRAAGHWASLPGRKKTYPRVTWLTNVRYVADGDVASSAQAKMSPRSFARAYAAKVGRTPAKTVESMRLEAACRALEETRLPLKTVADQAGYADGQKLWRAVRRRLGVNPASYRARFSAGPAGDKAE